MKKSASTLLFLICLLLPLSACSKKVTQKDGRKYITEKVSLNKSFTSLQLQGSPDVFYTQTTGTPRAEIYASTEIMPNVQVLVEGSTLVVRMKKGKYTNIGKLEVRVWGPALDEFVVRGSGDIILTKGLETDGNVKLHVQGSGDIAGGEINCQKLTALVQGSGDINVSRANAQFIRADVNGSGDVNVMKIEAQLVEATVQGSGDVVLTGETKLAKLRVQGSGDITAKNLKAENAETYINGSGDIAVHAISTLKGRVSGSGEVRYIGNPHIDFPRKGLKRL